MLTTTELLELNETYANTNIADEGTIREYYDTRTQIEQFTEDIQFVMSHPSHCLSFIQPGRLVHVKHQGLDFGWGAVVNYKERKPQKNSQEVISDHQKYVVDILLKVPDGTSVGTKTFEELPSGVVPPTQGQKVKVEVVPAMLACIKAFAQLRVPLPKDLRSVDSRNNAKNLLNEVQRRFPDGLPIADPIEDMHIKDDGFKKTLRVSSLDYKDAIITLVAN